MGWTMPACPYCEGPRNYQHCGPIFLRGLNYHILQISEIILAHMLRDRRQEMRESAEQKEKAGLLCRVFSSALVWEDER